MTEGPATDAAATGSETEDSETTGKQSEGEGAEEVRPAPSSLQDEPTDGTEPLNPA